MADRPAILRRLLRRLVRHPHYKLLSATIAVSVWLYVQGEQVEQERVRATVDWITPVALLTTEDLPKTVTLTVEGPLNAVRKARRANIELIADLSQATVGEANVDFSALTVQGLPSSVTIDNYSPSSIRFVLDEADTRRVEVSPVTVGEPGGGYVVAGVVMDPGVVQIRGPRVLVEEVGEVPTKPIDVTDLAGDSDLLVELDLPRGVELLGDTPVARVDIEAMVQSRTFTEVPVFVDQGGWQVQPARVMVRLRGPASALRRIEASQVIARVHLPTEPTASRYPVPYGPTAGVRLEILKGDLEVEVANVTPQTVEVRRP